MRRLLPVIVLLLVAVGVVVRADIPCDTVRLQPDCYIALNPGPTENALGMVTVRGERTYASAGQLRITTVTVDTDLDLRDWIGSALSRRVDQMPREAFIPPGTDAEEARRISVAAMSESQLDATIAALRSLGHEVDEEPRGAQVGGLLPDLPAEDVLELGDVIVAVDGEPIRSADGAATLLGDRSPGEVVSLRVLRSAGEDDAVGHDVEGQHRDELDLEVELAADRDEPHRALLGVLLMDHLVLPVDVRIDAGRVGGPSAGMMFALATVDLLTPEDLTGGAVVAGTGSIDRSGRVGAMGGVRQKLIAAVNDADVPATVFLVPAANVDDARRSPVSRQVQVVPVRTLDDAVRALEDVRAGRPPEGSFSIGRSGG